MKIWKALCLSLLLPAVQVAAQPGPPINPPGPPEFVRDRLCVADCRRDQRACAVDASREARECATACVELLRAAGEACEADPASEACEAARAEARECIRPCAEGRAAARTECRADAATCASQCPDVEPPAKPESRAPVCVGACVAALRDCVGGEREKARSCRSEECVELIDTAREACGADPASEECRSAQLAAIDCLRACRDDLRGGRQECVGSMQSCIRSCPENAPEDVPAP